MPDAEAPPAIRGFNHLTLSVSDLARSVEFYHRVLGLALHATWARGAYLSAGPFWLCLSVDSEVRDGPLDEYTHLAFSLPREDFAAFSGRLAASGSREWKENSSEGESIYFLDPDGHKLEVHAGSLESRLESLRRAPYDGLRLHGE